MEELYKGKFMSLKKVGNWEYVERNNCRSAVIIIPITDEDEIVLIEQMRIPLGRNVIEFPAGLVGDDCSEESFLQAACRELEEETGYVLKDNDCSYYGEFCTSPGLTNEKVHLIRFNVVKKDGANPEDGIKLHVVPLVDFSKWISNKRETHDISVKVLLYSLNFEDCGCDYVEEEIDVMDEYDPSSITFKYTRDEATTNGFTFNTQFVKNFTINLAYWSTIFIVANILGSIIPKLINHIWN